MFDGGITNAGVPATCGHAVTGSNTVFIEDMGMSKLIVDGVVVVGPIIGPGSKMVFCEDYPVSIEGDFIAPHTTCDSGDQEHCTAQTQGSPSVFAGGN